MSEPVYFLKLELQNVYCFGENTTLDLSDGIGNWKRWTVILGDNGTGKTTLLRQLGASENNHVADTSFLFASSDTNSQYIKLICVNDDIESEKLAASFKKQFGCYVIVWNNNFNKLECFGYGANRFMSFNSLTENKSENSETLFNDDAKLINAEEWLLQLDYAASKDSDIKAFAQKKRSQVEQILIDLLPDVKAIRFTTPTKEFLRSTVQFKTSFGWISIHHLSLGYKTMVAWMVDLAARLFERYPDSDNPLAEPAIVLVDEIDLHLHPKWQRKIFDYLSEKFPQTQFIVTAHSPLIVQSAPADANIVVLRKQGNYVVIDNDVKSVRDWRIDQIMSSDLFDIPSARSAETEKWLNERKELLQKPTLSHDEKARLAVLNQLAHDLPTADNEEDIEAMNIIREAAEYLKAQKA